VQAIAPPSGAAQPSGSANPTSSLDALRVACARRRAASPATEDRGSPLAALSPNPGAATYALDGTPIGNQSHPASYVAAAAAAEGSRHDGTTEQLLDRAQDADSSQPTYYGAAWVALGRVMLTSSALGAAGLVAWEGRLRKIRWWVRPSRVNRFAPLHLVATIRRSVIPTGAHIPLCRACRRPRKLNPCPCRQRFGHSQALVEDVGTFRADQQIPILRR